MAVITWMAGLFYLPRLFVYHAERATPGSEMSETFKVMEHKLLKYITNPSSIVTWVFGLLMLWSLGWDYLVDNHWLQIKLVLISAMTWFHHKLAKFTKDFAADANTRSGRSYRMWNEMPTLLMLVIVPLAVLKPF
ncbi:protoporphyrinogen oxidase HemJ [Rhodovulum sp. DZ06]|uniref:protoporphyrinogen oxidase HemJ n=1 Tax=Rhodovulum sp. DZ06 TaxID=3425126 RepID=UPI003D3559B1